MSSFAFIPFAAALILACGIIYRYFPLDCIKGRNSNAVMRIFRPARAAGRAPAMETAADTAADNVIETAKGGLIGTEELLRREVGRVRKLAAELNKGRLDIEWSERQLEEKSRKLDLLMAKAEEVLTKAAPTEDGMNTDNYSKAGMLLEMGLPAEDIKSRLGLTSGEFELIERLERYRSGGAVEGEERKKTPHREDTSHARRGEAMRPAGQFA